MTVPREPHRPPSPPDRRPSPRGGHPSSQTASAARPAGLARLAGARRCLVHSARPLAAVALFALVGALALPATAQAQESVLVSNIAESSDNTLSISSPTFSIGTVDIGERQEAQRFTAGPNTAGYVLQSVALHLSGGGSNARVQVAIHENNSSGNPGAQLAVLDNPVDPFGLSVTFSAPSPLSLVAGSPYWVVISNTATTSSAFNVSRTQSNDQTTTQGFSIRDTNHKGTPGSWDEDPDYAVRMEVRGTVAIPLPAVTIAADHESFTAVLDQVTFTLTRTGDLAEGLDVSVALTQDKDLIGSEHLAQTVEFRAGEATAPLSIYAYFFAGNTVTGETALTATVQDGSGYTVGDPATASTRIRVADPAVTASFEQAAYTFDEAAGDATLAVILRTATGVPVPHADIFLSINTAIITDGASPDDFEKPAASIQFVPSDFTADGTNFTARKEVTLAIVDDALDEPDEALTVILEPLPSTQAVVALSEPDGTACPSDRRCNATVTITDNDSAVATLSALAVSGGGADLLTFASDNTTYTAMVANDVETLTFSATKSDAGASVAYLDSDGNTLDDADTTEDGFQVALAVGANAITVRVTAENGTIQDYTVTVTRAEGLPTVTVAADRDSYAEVQGNAVFTLSRTGSTAATLTVTVEVTQQVDRDLLPDGAAAERTVTFAVASATAALTVALENDDLAELPGNLTVRVQAGMGYTVGAPGSATVSVYDRDTGRPTPANLTASAGAGVGEVVLSWDAHAPYLVFFRHQYRYKTDGDYPTEWTDIPSSGLNSGPVDGSNLTGYTVTGLVGGQLHTFQVRTHSSASSASDPSDEVSETPCSAFSVVRGGVVLGGRGRHGGCDGAARRYASRVDAR